jgi:tetratricopeptide (TPR) repeat protein
LIAAGGAGGYSYWQRRQQIESHYAEAGRLAEAGSYDGYARSRDDYVAIIKLDPRDDRAAAELAGTNALLMLDYGEDLESGVQTLVRRAEKQLERHRNAVAPAALAVGRAILAIGRGDFASAREITVKAEASHPGDARLPYVAAAARASAGEFAGARELLAQALKANPRYVPALVALGLLQADQGEFDAAEESYRRALAISPEHPRALLQRAFLRIDRGRELERAIADLNVTLSRAAEASPPMAAWRKLGLGELALRMGDVERAGQHLDAAARAPIEDPRFLLRLARARLDQGKIGDADKLLRRIAKLRSARDPQVQALDAEIALAKGFDERVVTAMGGGMVGPPRIRIALARALYALGKLDEAAAALDAALREVPDDRTALVYRALTRAQKGEAQVAERDLERLARTSTSTLPRYALGKLALDHGELEKARLHLEAATTGNPESYRAAVLLSQIAERQGRVGDALLALEKAVSQNPSYVPARVELGLLDVKTGRWRAGMRELKAAIDAGQSRPQLQLALARAQVELGFADDAEKALEKARAAGADPSAVTELAAVAESWNPKQAQIAARKLEALHRRAPRDLTLLIDLGTSWRRAGIARASEVAFQKAAQIDPENVDARLGMAKLRLLAGDAMHAAVLYHDAEALYHRRPYLAPEKLTEIQIGLGRAYLMPGPTHAVDRAKKALEAAVAADPQDPEVQYYLGRLYLESGQIGRARDALARAVELDPEFADAHFTLAEVVRATDAARARRGYERYLALMPQGEHAKAARKALETLK